jgi:enoyl-CoA hydratase/carnithine racemase
MAQPADGREDRVGYRVAGQVATITLQRPEKLNAMDRRGFAALEAAAGRAAADPGIRAVVVTGAGRAFCTGVDAAELAAVADLDQAERYLAEVQRAIEAVERLPKPVIAAVNGLAGGGGLQLALACDLRLAAASAQFAAWEMRWAIVPDLAGARRLPQLVGLGRAKELVFTGRQVDAAEAQRIGLANRVVADELLAAEAAELAAGLAAGPTLALGLAKQALDAAFGQPDEAALAARQAQRRTLASADHAEARAAYTERRSPRFGGA